MFPNNTSNAGSSDPTFKLTGHAALPVVSYPHLLKKRFHREKKNNLKLKMRRSLSAPLNSLVLPPTTQTTAATPSEEEPLSPDRWGTSAKTVTSLSSLAIAPTLPSRRPGFVNVQKDSQFQLPRRQRSFQDDASDSDCDNNSSPHLQQQQQQQQQQQPPLFVRRTKSNVEAVGRIIDEVLLELQHHSLQQQ